MSKKRKQDLELSFIEQIKIIKQAGLKNRIPTELEPEGDYPEPDLNKRIEKIFGIYNTYTKQKNHMIYFVMYDIEDNKVRRQVAKYLEQKGCTRVQKSVFLAESERKQFDDIYRTLKEVNEMYENFDSLLFVPVSSDLLRSMKIVGKNVDFEMVVGNKGTLFF